MLILDTDELSLIQRRAGPEYAILTSRLARYDEKSVFITIVTVEEQTRGWLQYSARARQPEELVRAYAKLHDMLRDICPRQILDFDDRVAARYFALKKQHRRLSAPDLRIAAHALVHDATLISRNLRDFRKVPGLKVEDWTLPLQEG